MFISDALKPLFLLLDLFPLGFCFLEVPAGYISFDFLSFMELPKGDRRTKKPEKRTRTNLAFSSMS